MGKEGNGRGGFVPSFLILIVLGLGGFAAEIFAQAPQVDSFNPGYARQVWSIALQPDGKVLVGGWFNIGGQTSLARLNRDGTLDSWFNPAGDYGYKPAIQADGKIVVGGSVRLNPDGTDDSSFNPPSPNGFVEALVVQADGKIVLGGGFTRLDIEIRNHAARLNADGTLDDGFDPDIDGPLFALALQTDGKIVVGGGFYHVAGQSRTMIARLNADGTLDNSFNPAATDPSVRALG